MVAPEPLRIRTVFFDLGGTLLNEYDFPDWVEVGRAVGITLDESHLAHAYLEVDRENDRPDPPPLLVWWREVLTRASGVPVSEETTRAFGERLAAHPTELRLYSDARRCLVQLREQGRRMSVISNSRSEEHLGDLLERAGIRSFFDVLVSSGTEGVAKPDRRIFERALARTGSRAEESFHVGDRAFRDAKAAAAAGLRSVWLNREGTGFGEDPPEITSLTELPFYLLSLEGRLDVAPVK